jgi:hypothetical protein
MRGELALNNGVIVREIRPIDLKRAIDVLTQSGDLNSDEVDSIHFQTALLSNSDLIQSKTDLLTKYIAVFITFNEAFYSGSGDGSSRSLKSIADEINHTCAVLIHHGHINCWQYGWAFFQAVQGLYKE